MGMIGIFIHLLLLFMDTNTTQVLPMEQPNSLHEPHRKRPTHVLRSENRLWWVWWVGARRTADRAAAARGWPPATGHLGASAGRDSGGTCQHLFEFGFEREHTSGVGLFENQWGCEAGAVVRSPVGDSLGGCCWLVCRGIGYIKVGYIFKGPWLLLLALVQVTEYVL